MKKYISIAIFIFAVIGTGSMPLYAQADSLKFDEALAADFSKGMNGDAASLERALERSDKILAANPKDARTLVWAGSATLAGSGKLFMAGNFMEGGKSWKEGRRKMDEAVALDGGNTEILMTRGTTYLSASKQFPVKEEADTILKLGLGDYEKIAADNSFGHFPESMRSKVLLGLAEGWERAGDTGKAKAFYQTLSTGTAGETRENAVKWLTNHQS